MEVARRLAMPVFGINLPRHFIVQFDDGNYATYIDPFHGGRTITPRECFALAGAQVADPALLQRVSKKQIVMRMVQNLHLIYSRRRDSERAIRTLDLLILGAPEISAGYKSRGLLLLEAKRYQAARRDLERYLALEPEAADRAQIRKLVETIHRWLASLN
jgi:regulator of sirC expression with transglutaminase-like and TPR domain